MHSSKDFDYQVPPDLIAQHPAEDRAGSRLLVLDRSTGHVTHRQFREFPSLIRPGDVLVTNVSRVMAARLIGTRDNGRRAEMLLVHPEPDGTWQAMVHPGGKLKAGRRVHFGDAEGREGGRAGEAEIIDVLGGGLRRVRFHGMDAREVMDEWGEVPLPPYIDRKPVAADRDRYQTVYATTDGSIAAPTAGLHFTPEILDQVKRGGATIAPVTLHVGPGTFKPVEVDDPTQHVMHAEWYEISATTAEAVNTAKARGGRVWAVGTTACRVLETGWAVNRSAVERAGGQLNAGSGWTNLFIHPPYTFSVVDALLTNFHLPRSTLLMLVAAFAGYAATMNAYREAVTERYRLYSYGDAMVVI